MTEQLNQAVLTAQVDAINSIINATPTGGTDTAVLRFNVAGTVNGRIAETTSAAAGTVVTITAPGLYSVDMSLINAGAVAAAAGIGLNMAAAPIIADPVVGTDGVIKAVDTLGVAAGNWPIELGTTFLVSAVLATAGFTVRFLCTDSAAGAPAGLVAADASYRIQKLANTPF